jgi:hypothetical protein
VKRPLIVGLIPANDPKRSAASKPQAYMGTTNFDHCLKVYAEWKVVTMGTSHS